MPNAVNANYVSDLDFSGKHLRLTVTATIEGDVVATVYDMDSTASVYMTYDVKDIEQAKEKAEEAALEYLGTTHSLPFKWTRTA
jgi:hypothetical protein